MILRRKTNSIPKIGDKKIVKKFAWLPKKVTYLYGKDMEYIILLEKYRIEYEYLADYKIPVLSKWVKISKFII